MKHTGNQVRKDRKLRLPSDIIPVFEDYVTQYAITDSLFPYTPRFIELLLASAARHIKLHKKVTAGIMRDTFVVRSLKQGAKLEDVLRKMGLSDSSWEDARLKYTRLASRGI